MIYVTVQIQARSDRPESSLRASHGCIVGLRSEQGVTHLRMTSRHRLTVPALLQYVPEGQGVGLEGSSHVNPTEQGRHVDEALTLQVPRNKEYVRNNARHKSL